MSQSDAQRMYGAAEFHYQLFADRPSMDRWLTGWVELTDPSFGPPFAGSPEPAGCTGPGHATWAEGRVVCIRLTEGAAEEVWTHDRLLVLVDAYRIDLDWTQLDQFRSRAGPQG